MTLMLRISAALLLTALPAAHAQYREPALTPVNGPVKLTIWTWQPSTPAAVKLFEKRYPNITVELANLGADGTYSKLQTTLKAGTGAPDLALMEYDHLPAFIETGGLLDLSGAGAGKYKSVYAPWTWNQISPDGKSVFALPYNSGPFGMVYRKDIFDRYNLKVPTTWAEYAKTAEDLSRKSNGQVKMGNFYPNVAAWFYALVWAAGGQMFTQQNGDWKQTLNSPAAKKVALYWQDLIKKNQVSTLSAFTPDYWNAVSAGKVATAFEASWGPGLYATSTDKALSGRYRVAPLPQWTKGERFSNGNWGGGGIVVTKQSKNPQAALLLAAWLTTSQAALSNDAKDGIAPAAPAAFALLALHDKTKDPLKFFGGQDITALFQTASKGVNVNFQWAPWLPKVNDSYLKQLDSVLKKGVPFDQALDRWQAETLGQARDDGYTVSGP